LTLQELAESAELGQNSELRLSLLYQFCKECLDPDDGRVDNIERQNVGLTKVILDNSKWFVSPRGDRFSQERDIEIGSKGISSIVFRIDKKYPREHKVFVTLDVSSKPFVFWVDKEGKLLNEDRGTLTLDATQKQLLTNVVLRRLYLITSGDLSKYEELEFGEESMLGRIFEWKRAHYREYPIGSIYTLGSEGAKVHAKEIKEDYGIDIWEEIRRRRKVGTLAEGQVMTFVREVSPRDEVGNELVTPNELPFDPEWVPLRL